MPAKRSRSPSSDDDVPKNKDSAPESEEEEEEEYEIEEILDAQRGRFPGGRLAYFVRWKGYGPEDDSWVDEKDAGNAQELIDNFWKKKNKHDELRAQKEAKSAKKARQSTASASVRKSGSTATSRGTKSARSHEDDMDVDRDEDSPPASKRVKRAPKTTGRSVSETPEPQAPEFKSMDASYMKVADWEPLVKQIDTVERVDDDLIVYFTLKSGEQVRESSKVCRKRFPQKLIDFYERNLRWKMADDDS
ncbi:hypothetical protein CC1G_08322 [Coprinopsis cinerea okayama7|uniref:Chromo domain-containing protein n=1 Tax=Coprinopsis cinerea (strain Okayama-7 / 130 / ATCC MYA-4618 / FGSC 9003) TaxID=240176 RepID=A8NA63_COPC7|nr:hypothetical protein CC1G_08322 [Coprinopsis cinerea okayama7\|eukprot:XP_001831718.2 hypothetical protein CC1G_08322 [Coprinopsis cinerea okayama7\